jgi:ArsR family transcriptional regulator
LFIRDAGLVSVRREGTWVFYRLASPLLRWVRDLLNTLRADAVLDLSADRARLKKMAGRPARVAA